MLFREDSGDLQRPVLISLAKDSWMHVSTLLKAEERTFGKDERVQHLKLIQPEVVTVPIDWKIT